MRAQQPIPTMLANGHRACHQKVAWTNLSNTHSHSSQTLGNSGKQAKRLCNALCSDWPSQSARHTPEIRVSNTKNHLNIQGFRGNLEDREDMVRSRRLELPLRLKNSDLNAARLPIPPRPHLSSRAIDKSFTNVKQKYPRFSFL